MGRFLNADAFASTGQGVLGNNMFAYCGNNPVNYSDPAGCIRQKFTPIYEDDGFHYILNQHDEAIASLPLGESTVGRMGCALVAIYNALLMLGDYTSFEEIYDYFTAGGRLVDNGNGGVNIVEVIKYLKNKGYDISLHTTTLPYQMNQGASQADACIMLYRFYNIKNKKVSFSGHYIAFGLDNDGFVGYNTIETGGVTRFFDPTVYGLSGKRYFTYVICITNPQGEGY